jgi:hypothetical protein
VALHLTNAMQFQSMILASDGRPNNGVNPTAGGRRPPSSRDGLSPAAGYTERSADIIWLSAPEWKESGC